MSAAALGLVLLAAGFHATWNYLAKRAGGGWPFVWLCSALSALLYAPLAAAAVLVVQPPLAAPQILAMAGSAALHLAYFLLLQQGYRAGDLSVVYPLARGTGPLLSTAAAVALFGERPTPLALAGALLVAAGAVALTGDPRALSRRGRGAAIVYGLLTGAVIAGYTLWDKRAVGALAVPPLLLDWGNNAGRTLLLAPLALPRRAQVRAEWRAHRREVLGVAILGPLSYVLVLTALVFTPVSYVAPAREVSVLIGALLGTRLLAEGEGPRRLAAAGAIALGVAALALG